MQKPARLLGLSLVFLPACGPETGQTGSEPGSTTGSSSNTSEPTPTTTLATDSVSTGTTDTSAGSTTEVSAATTVDSTASTTAESATEVSATTTLDSTTSTTADDTTGPLPDTSTGDTDDPLDTTGGMVCGGFQEAMTAWNLVVPPDLAGADIDADCEVVDVVMQGPDVILELACQIDAEPTTIEIEYTVAPDIPEEWFPGSDLHLAYRTTQPFWKNEWLALTSGASFSLLAVRADALAPPATTPEEFFKNEMWLARPCGPAEPDRCGMRETLGLGFAYILDDGTPISIEVESGEYHKFGVFTFDEIFVERATHLIEPITCDDVPSTWIEAMVLKTSIL